MAGHSPKPQWRPALAWAAIVVFTSLSAQAAEPVAKASTAPDHAIFCAYNLKNWLQMDRQFASKGSPTTPKPEKEKAALLKTLVAIQPDILGVCEIGSDADVLDLQTRLRAVGLDYPHTERAHGGDEVRALALLSRFPIVSRQSQNALRYRMGEVSFPVQRGFLDVTVRLAADFDLRCIGVHLKSKREVEGADQALMRRNESFLLRGHVDGILGAAPATRLLVYGDFNEHRNEPPLTELFGNDAEPSKRLYDVFLRDANGEMWTHFWDFQDVYSRFDYFLVSPPLRAHVNTRLSTIHSDRDFMKASDHRPIVLRIDFAAKKKR